MLTEKQRQALQLRWRKQTLEERFWSKVQKGSKEQCWPWTGYRNVANYGQFQIKTRLWKFAHRFSYETTFGWFEPRWIVMHKCDNPPCCNPHHLKLGTRFDNYADMVTKGRHPKIRKLKRGRNDGAN